MKFSAYVILKMALIVVIAIPGVFFLKAIYDAPTVISGMSCDEATVSLKDLLGFFETSGRSLADSFSGSIFSETIITYLEKKETSPPGPVRQYATVVCNLGNFIGL